MDNHETVASYNSRRETMRWRHIASVFACLALASFDGRNTCEAFVANHRSRHNVKNGFRRINRRAKQTNGRMGQQRKVLPTNYMVKERVNEVSSSDEKKTEPRDTQQHEEEETSWPAYLLKTWTKDVFLGGGDDDDAKTMTEQPQEQREFTSESTTGEDATTSLDRLEGWARDNMFLGIEPTPEIVAIATIYFVEGSLGLARLAQTYLLKDELHLGPAELSALSGIFVLPWTIKPLYGFLSDGVPLFGYKRRSYLVLCGFLGALSYLALGNDFGGIFADNPGLSLSGTVASLLISSACIAFSDVVADGMVVQRTRDSNDPKVAGGLQSLCWGSAALGGLLSAYWSGSLLEVMSVRQVFGITAVLPFIVAMIALLIDETPVVNQSPPPADNNSLLLPSGPTTTVANPITRSNGAATNDDGQIVGSNSQQEGGGGGGETTQLSMKEQTEALWSAIKEPSIWKPALFLLLWQSTPTSDGAFFYFMSNDLGMGPEFMGRVRLVSSAAGLFGVWLYQKYLRTVKIKDILYWSTILSFPLGLSTVVLITHFNRVIGIPDGAFVFGDDVALAVLGQIAFLPTLVLAARICPPGIEAVLFATLMSINNGAGTLGTEIGAALTKLFGVTDTDFDNLMWLTILCNVSSLYPLLFIDYLLDGVGEMTEGDDDDNSDNKTTEEGTIAI